MKQGVAATGEEVHNKSVLAKLLQVGISKDTPENLRTKIGLANKLFPIIFASALLYGAYIAVKMPVLSFLPYLEVTVLLIAFGLNYLGFHQIYRTVLCLAPALTVAIYQIGIVPEGGTFMPSSAVMTLACGVLPFVTFDLKERLPLAFSVICCYIFLISPRALSGWLETGLDDTAVRHSSMQEFSITISYAILCWAVYSLNKTNRRAIEQTNSLMEEGKRRNEEIEAQKQEMQRHLASLEEARLEEEKRNWAAQGYSEFGVILRQTEDLSELYDRLISKLVKYIGANQGGMYVAEGKGKEIKLELKSCFAYERKKFVDKVIEPGQGLVGQCFLEKQSTYLTRVPNGYTHITSGLGDATPGALVLIPLKHNGVVEGVVEIASFKPLEEYIIAFLEKLGEDIAASLNIVKMNALTRSLLADAQQQAEEMRAQEEEMRQNMEELAATQEEMERKEQEYIRQIESLKKEMDHTSVSN